MTAMRFMRDLPAIKFVVLLVSAQPPAAAADEPHPEAKAVAYLVQEVPRWRHGNGCFSCHHNGDGYRTLLAARALGMTVPDEALRETRGFLEQPAQWRKDLKDPEVSDVVLARIHFARALAAQAVEARKADTRSVELAAALVAADQRPDGSWLGDPHGAVGSPITYGPFLATFTSVEVLRQADPQRYAGAVARGEAFLAKAPTVQTLALAVKLLAGEAVTPAAQRRALVAELVQRQNPDGGWGPFSQTPSEPFDTALALLALSQNANASAATIPARQRARAYLIRSQTPEGYWPETTRPAGAESYAHRVATTAWATRALLATRSLAADDKRHAHER